MNRHAPYLVAIRSVSVVAWQSIWGHWINIGGLIVQGVMEFEDNGIIKGIVVGVKELGGVKELRQ